MKKPKLVWSIGYFAEILRQRQLKKFDCNIIVDGPRGNSKSTFVYKLFARFNKFNPQRDIVFSRNDLINGLVKKRFGLIFADEMINSAHNREFFGTQQIDLIKKINMYRDHFNILAGCVPNFYDLDKQFRGLVKFRVTLVKRGEAIVQIAKPSLYTNDPWDTDFNKKVERQFEEKMRKRPNSKIDYSRLSTFKAIIRFNDITPRQREIYEAIKVKKRQAMEDEKEAEKGKAEEGKTFKVDLDALCKQTILLVEQGMLKREDLDAIARANQLVPNNFVGAIQKRLKNMGKPTLSIILKRLATPILVEQRRAKTNLVEKDDLGYSVNRTT